jgi:succinyl-CoA synthetase alpha subunit
VSIFIDENTRVVVQGIGSQGTFHARRNQAYGTQIVAGTHPRKGGTTWEELEVPVLASVKEAVEETGANTSMVMVPAPFTKDAILEAHDAGIATIVVVTEGVPVHKIRHYVVRKFSDLAGLADNHR